MSAETEDGLDRQLASSSRTTRRHRRTLARCEPCPRLPHPGGRLTRADAVGGAGPQEMTDGVADLAGVLLDVLLAGQLLGFKRGGQGAFSRVAPRASTGSAGFLRAEHRAGCTSERMRAGPHRPDSNRRCARAASRRPFHRSRVARLGCVLPNPASASSLGCVQPRTADRPLMRTRSLPSAAAGTVS